MLGKLKVPNDGKCILRSYLKLFIFTNHGRDKEHSKWMSVVVMKMMMLMMVKLSAIIVVDVVVVLRRWGKREEKEEREEEMAER